MEFNPPDQIRSCSHLMCLSALLFISDDFHHPTEGDFFTIIDKNGTKPKMHLITNVLKLRIKDNMDSKVVRVLSLFPLDFFYI